MGLRFEGFALGRFNTEPAAVPSQRFLHQWEIIFCYDGQGRWTNALQIISPNNFCKNPKDIFPVFMEIIITKTVTIILNPPYDRAYTDTETDDIDKRI